MASYLLQVAYTPQAWAALLKNPHDRTQALKPVLEKLGGRFEAAYFAFGDYDVVAVLELPKDTDATAFSIAAAASGAIKAIKTTPLMSIAEGSARSRRRGESGTCRRAARPLASESQASTRAAAASASAATAFIPPSVNASSPRARTGTPAHRQARAAIAGLREIRVDESREERGGQLGWAPASAVSNSAISRHTRSPFT